MIGSAKQFHLDSDSVILFFKNFNYKDIFFFLMLQEV